MAEIVEQRWKKTCNGPEGPLAPPKVGEPGRDVRVDVLDTAEVIVDCNNFREGKCAIGSGKNDQCIFSSVLAEPQRTRQEFLYRAIRAQSGISQRGLVELLGASQPTISRDVARLVEDGIVSQSEVIQVGPGHPTTLFHVRETKANLLE